MSSRFRVTFFLTIAAIAGLGVGFQVRRLQRRIGTDSNLANLHDRYLEALQHESVEQWI